MGILRSTLKLDQIEKYEAEYYEQGSEILKLH